MSEGIGKQFHEAVTAVVLHSYRQITAIPIIKPIGDMGDRSRLVSYLNGGSAILLEAIAVDSG